MPRVRDVVIDHVDETPVRHQTAHRLDAVSYTHLDVYKRQLYELADFVYHTLVFLNMRGLTWDEVEAELAERFK